MIAGAFILGVGVLLGVGILLVVEHLGTPKFAAPSVQTQTRTTIPDPNARAESSSADGAAKVPFRPHLKTMSAFLRGIEAKVNKMPEPQREAIMEKLRRGAY
jgi:hypothetical protein